jgi:hypothetical protein
MTTRDLHSVTIMEVTAMRHERQRAGELRHTLVSRHLRNDVENFDGCVTASFFCVLMTDCISEINVGNQKMVVPAVLSMAGIFTWYFGPTRVAARGKMRSSGSGSERNQNGAVKERGA